MAFLFKSKKHQQNAAQPQSKDGQPTANSTSSIPSINGGPVGPKVSEKDRPQERTTTPGGGSVNNSLNSLAGTATPSPEQKTIRDRSDSELQQNSRGVNQAPLASQLNSNPNASLYPWSQRRLAFTSSHPSPFPRYGAATNSSASKEGDIYLMGGLINGSAVKGDLWLVEAGGKLSCFPLVVEGEAPGPRVGHASLLVGNAFIVYGGDTKMDDRDTLDDTLWLLNTTTKQWSRAIPPGPKPTGRYGHTLNIIGSKIYIFGGQVEGFFFNDLVAFDLNALQSPNNRWELLILNSSQTGAPASQIPPARTNHTVVTLNEKLYLFGGTNGVQWFNDVWCYEPRTNQWTQLDCIGYIPAPREGHAAALVGDVMYIFGGRTENGDDLGDLAAFRISSRRWYTFQNMGPSPSPRSGHSMTAYNKQIVVLGGEPSAAGGDVGELSLVYLLDTSKIRYPNDQPNQQGQIPAYVGDRNAPGIRRPSGGDKNGPSQLRGPPGRGAPGPMGDPKRIGGPNEPPREPPMGGNAFNRGPDPNAPSVNGAGSRLPRASLAQAPSGPPPPQSAPPPRLNGLGPSPGPRSKTPPSKLERFGPNAESVRTAPAAEKENISPAGPVRDGPSNAKDAPLTNGRRTPTQTPTKIGGMKPRDTPEPENLGSLRSRSRQARQQASIDSTNESNIQTSTANERSAPIDAASTKVETLSKTEPVQIERSHSINQRHQAMAKELEAVKSKNAWYGSELALARKAGYTPNAAGGPILDEKSNESFGDQERPLVEALLAMRAELARVQTDVESQTAQAAKQIAEVEKQRDAAVSEAVYAKAKLAAHGGSATSTPQPEGSSREVAAMEMDRMTDLNRKLASSLAMQNELQQRLDALNADMESERRARQHAEETANAAHARVSELDLYKQKNASEVESLRAELHAVEKFAREEAAKCSEATSSAKMLQLDKEELSKRLEEASGATKGHSTTLVSLRDAVSASSEKSSTLQRKLDEERSHRDGLETKLRQLRAAHEERTAELDTTTRRLKDAEEMAEKHAAEARTHREAVLSGLGQASSRDLVLETSAVDERVKILQAQLDHSNMLTRKSQAAADAASEKLRSAEERIAGLESYQEQSSRDGMSIRKQLQNAMRELQTVHAEHNDTKQKLSNHQLEAKSMEIQHSALRDLLGERGINALDGRRSRGSPGSNSGFGTPEQTRLRDLEQQLETSVKAHQETKLTLEQREQEAEQQYRERVEQLEGDYQSAVHYIKGTEKMLKRMKDELARSKTLNVKLQSDLEATAASGTTRSANDEADWEKERNGLKEEIEQLHGHVKTSVSQLDQQLAQVRGELKTIQDERDLYKENSVRSERQITEITQKARAELEQLKSENQLLEFRAQDAEGKVTTYLNQMEMSVDNQRRLSRPIDVNGESGHTRVPSNGTVDRDSNSVSSMYGPDNRTSLALDNLTSELNALRSHWETNSKNRLSTTFDFEKGLTSPLAPEHSNSLADWRRRLDMEETAAGGRKSGESAGSTQGATKTLSHPPPKTESTSQATPATSNVI